MKFNAAIIFNQSFHKEMLKSYKLFRLSTRGKRTVTCSPKLEYAQSVALKFETHRNTVFEYNCAKFK